MAFLSFEMKNKTTKKKKKWGRGHQNVDKTVIAVSQYNSFGYFCSIRILKWYPKKGNNK